MANDPPHEEPPDGARGGDPRLQKTVDLAGVRVPAEGDASAASDATYRFERARVDPGAAPVAEELPPEAPGRYVAPGDGPELVGEGGMGRVVAVVGSGREMAILRGHRHRVQNVAFAPDGSHLVSTGWEGIVASWDLPAATADPAAMVAEAERRFGLKLEGATVVASK